MRPSLQCLIHTSFVSQFFIAPMLVKHARTGITAVMFSPSTCAPCASVKCDIIARRHCRGMTLIMSVVGPQAGFANASAIYSRLAVQAKISLIRQERNSHAQAHVSTQSPSPRQDARISRAHEDQE